MNIIARRKIFYIFSGTLFLASIILFLLWGLKFGIDFTGGALLEVEFPSSRPPISELQNRIQPLGVGSAQFSPSGDRGLLMRLRDVDEPTHQNLLNALAGVKDKTERDAVVREKQFSTIGPVIGKELAQRSIWALCTVLLLIVLYIAWAFRKISKPVSSWKFGVIAVVALLHDVFLPTGVFVVLGKLWGVEVDTLFVTAILTILGFSVHDTIVVFDRIRENLKKSSFAAVRTKEGFEQVVNESLNQTIVRSVNTSFVVLLTLAAIFLFGGESVRYFSLALMLGVVFGTYSSIFIASPLLVTWHNYSLRKTIS
ncbi:protein translocase subunit SecF [Patescibacteria group bacterium]|nr:protein translocase subunit SecF [Patescibacteria group bacterium]